MMTMVSILLLYRRPRYLELDENGVLRYYEATEDNNSMTTFHNHHHHHTSINNTIISERKNNINVNNNYNNGNDYDDENNDKQKQQQQQQEQEDHDQQQQQQYSMTRSEGSHKDFVHVSNDDIMNREMQAFSLPKHLDQSLLNSSTSCSHTNNTSGAVIVEEENKPDNNNIIKSSSFDIVNYEEENKNENDPKFLIHDLVYSPADKNEDNNDEIEKIEVENNGDEEKIIITTKNSLHDQSKNANEKDDMIKVKDYSNEQQTDLFTSLQILHHHVHKHRAKAVMTILSARIIDVNSLRDMHVGLPKDTYGFVFCGRQMFTNSDNNNLLDSDEQHDFRDDICHPLSILSSDKDYFDTSRDYLCSVSSLQEAQDWVSALRWAANVSRMKLTRRRLNSDLSSDQYYDENSLSDESLLDRSLSVGNVRSSRSPTRNQRYLNGLRRSDNLLEKLLVEDDDSLSSGERDHSSSLSEGMTIVTKVRNVALKLESQKRVFGFKFEVKFEVKMLVLRNIQLTHRSTKRKIDNIDSGNWSVQERTKYCSYDDMINLLKKLELETRNAKSSKSDATQNVIKEARDVLLSNTSDIFSSYSTAKLSIETVDRVLRTICTNQDLCNAETVKEFLLKDNGIFDKNFCPSFLHQQFSLIFDDKCSMGKKYLDIVVGESIDDFVKKWLFDSDESKGYYKVTNMLLLQNQFVESFLTLMVLRGIYHIYIIWFRYLRHSTFIRIDLWMIQSLAVFYCGYKAGSLFGESQRIGRDDEEKHTRNITQQNRRLYTTASTRIESDNSIDIDEDEDSILDDNELSSPLPYFSEHIPSSSWSRPQDKIFKVRGKTYLHDRVKVPSDPSPLQCRGIDMWLTNNPERNIARHPSMLGGKLGEEDTFVVNFLLPFGNFVTYFSIPPINKMPKNVAKVWTQFINGNQQDRDARLKLLPKVINGPWIVKKAIGHGPALLGQTIPLQYYFTHPTDKKKGVYEVDVIITASRLAKGILNVVKSHTKRLTIAFAFIIEGAQESELPETVLCSCQIHSLHLELCPSLPKYFLDDANESDGS